MFGKTKGKVDTFINDRVSAPIRASVTISVCAFILAGLALMIVVGRVRGAE
jgi:hypothetical protein